MRGNTIYVESHGTNCPAFLRTKRTFLKATSASPFLVVGMLIVKYLCLLFGGFLIFDSILTWD